MWRTKPVPSIGSIPIKFTRSSLSCCSRSEPISMGGDSTRRWPAGMGRWRAIHPNTATSHGSGRRLTGAPTRNTHVERDFDFEAIRKLKRESEHEISIGGAELAGLALEADLVDECHLFLNPVIVGGGKPAFRSALRRDLELLEMRRFGTGVIHVRYRIRGGTPYKA